VRRAVAATTPCCLRWQLQKKQKKQIKQIIQKKQKKQVFFIRASACFF
jgi:hypothetical protein